MAVKVRTPNPAQLLEKIYDKIRSDSIKTWACEVHSNRTYLSHVTPDGQWKGKAWLTAKHKDDVLTFNIVKPKTTNVTTIVYAIYHGRFTEMLLSHFDSEFSIIWSTALPSDGDTVQ